MKCPACGNDLHKVEWDADTSMLNEDQFISIRAGDWYCDKCDDNGRGNRPYSYWWDSEVKKQMRIITLIKPEDQSAISLMKETLNVFINETEERRRLAVERGDKSIARLLSDVIIKGNNAVESLYQLQLSTKANDNEA